MPAQVRWGFVVLILIVVFFFLMAATSIFLSLMRPEGLDITGSGDKIAIVELKGTIYSSERIVRQLKKFREDESIDAVLLRIDSPGGGVAASQEIYDEVRRIRESGKVIVISMGTVAASGGYYVSLGASKIIANPGTITGSIGVIADFMHTYGLLEKIGLKSTTIKSGKFKDSGSPLRDLTPDDRRYLQGLINNMYDQFIDVVVEERQIPREKVLEIADGRVYTGKQALELNLVDSLGSFEDAVSAACDMAGISRKARRITERRDKLRLIDFLFGDLEESLARLVRKSYVAYRLR